MEKKEIIKRATLLASRIRSGRVRMGKDPAAIALYNNVMGGAISRLKDCKYWLNKNNLFLANNSIIEAEQLYEQYI